MAARPTRPEWPCRPGTVACPSSGPGKPRIWDLRHGIGVVADLPGVGANLQDHTRIIPQAACPVGFPIHRVDRPINKRAAGARLVFSHDGMTASNI